MIEMMKIKIKKGYNCRNVDFDSGEFEFEVEKFDLKEVLKEVLIEEFGSEEECVRYFKEDFNSIKEGEGIDEVIKGSIELMEWDKKMEYWEGEISISEEGYCKIFVDGKLFLG